MFPSITKAAGETRKEEEEEEEEEGKNEARKRDKYN